MPPRRPMPPDATERLALRDEGMPAPDHPTRAAPAPYVTRCKAEPVDARVGVRGARLASV